MAATGLLLPTQQYFSSDGAPLAGGKVYTFVAGTSTPSPTYNSSDLLTPNANPTILDSAGRGVFYVDTAPALKVILKDSNDVTIWTNDNVSPAAVAS